jgi:hypothetical protein
MTRAPQAGTSQPVPAYTEQDLERIIARDYRDRAEHARKILAAYGGERFHREHLRVRMACLRLADGSIESLKRQVRNASQDFRDVLAWAEYPAYMTAHGPAEQQRAIQSDRNQLQEWLRKP